MLFLLFAAAFLAAPAAAEQYSRGLKKEIVWHPGRRIVVEEVAGGIEVRGVKSEKVEIGGLLTVEAKTLEKARAESGKLEMEVTSTRNEIRIVAKRPRNWRGVRGWIDYDIKVPLEALLILKTVSGDIRVIGSDGTIHANSVSGDIHIRGSSGNMEVRAVSGNVRLKNCPGDAVAETVSGGIQYDATEVDAKTITLRSTGGGVHAVFPPDFSATVQIVTVSGKIRSDLPLKTTREEKKVLKGVLGSGGADLRISTVSGSITVSTSGVEEDG
ncbi:MAG: DUF4097 family beta strand repeat-containing protein [bacterium]